MFVLNAKLCNFNFLILEVFGRLNFVSLFGFLHECYMHIQVIKLTTGIFNNVICRNLDAPKSIAANLVASGATVKTSMIDLTKLSISSQLLPPGGSFFRILPELSITNAMSATQAAIIISFTRNHSHDF